MDHYIPTIEELNRKTVRELDAIFRQAAEAADDATREPSERAAAKATLENVERCRTVRRQPSPF
jgi:hypothetical protein